MSGYFYVLLFGSLAMNVVLAYVTLRIALNPDRSPWRHDRHRQGRADRRGVIPRVVAGRCLAQPASSGGEGE